MLGGVRGGKKNDSKTRHGFQNWPPDSKTGNPSDSKTDPPIPKPDKRQLPNPEPRFQNQTPSKPSTSSTACIYTLRPDPPHSWYIIFYPLSTLSLCPIPHAPSPIPCPLLSHIIPHPHIPYHPLAFLGLACCSCHLLAWPWFSCRFSLVFVAFQIIFAGCPGFPCFSLLLLCLGFLAGCPSFSLVYIDFPVFPCVCRDQVNSERNR